MVDQAGDHSAQDTTKRSEFELNISEDPPTSDQLRSILEYVGARRAGDLVKGARDEADAMRRLKENGDNFVRPVVGSLFDTPRWADWILEGVADSVGTSDCGLE